ncbi:hypothetical protein N7510_002037 [Penicillium lagena]|uniref:uncharacterized protein n=1 Tax=Penicillium lagena TaxID=94218 RepID=UPI0025405D97|nr:uncharacterized protein N7510_002037 [Penicillium lagena]KAJ5625728.1 hypothetical protein N7510_002037 [Penicillium lagena]
MQSTRYIAHPGRHHQIPSALYLSASGAPPRGEGRDFHRLIILAATVGRGQAMTILTLLAGAILLNYAPRPKPARSAG